MEDNFIITLIGALCSAILLIWWRYCWAKRFEQVAIEKGFDGKEYFRLCFIFGIYGWIVVSALPDRRLHAQVLKIIDKIDGISIPKNDAGECESPNNSKRKSSKDITDQSHRNESVIDPESEKNINSDAFGDENPVEIESIDKEIEKLDQQINNMPERSIMEKLEQELGDLKRMQQSQANAKAKEREALQTLILEKETKIKNISGYLEANIAALNKKRAELFERKRMLENKQK